MKVTGKPDIILFRVICIVYLLSLITLCSSPVLAASSEERLLDFAEKARKTTVSLNEKPAASAEKSLKNTISENDRLAGFAEKARKTTVSENDRLAGFAKKASGIEVHSVPVNDRLLEFAEKASGITGGYGEEETADPRIVAFAEKAVETEKELEEKYGPLIVDHVKVIAPSLFNDTKIKNMTAFQPKTTVSTTIHEPFSTEPFYKNILPFSTEPFYKNILPFTDAAGKNEVSLGLFRLTAYDACIICCGKTDGITKSGIHAKSGRTVAVDPDVIPLGSRIRINGHTYIAEDTGSAVKGYHIDIFMDTHEEAKRFGNRYARVFLEE